MSQYDPQHDSKRSLALEQSLSEQRDVRVIGLYKKLGRAGLCLGFMAATSVVYGATYLLILARTHGAGPASCALLAVFLALSAEFPNIMLRLPLPECNNKPLGHDLGAVPTIVHLFSAPLALANIVLSAYWLVHAITGSEHGAGKLTLLTAFLGAAAGLFAEGFWRALRKARARKDMGIVGEKAA